MKRKEYLEALSSYDLDERRKALTSDYIPKNTDEVNQALQSVLIAKPDLQMLLLDHLEGQVSLSVALPAYISLATKAYEPETRLRAVRLIADEPSDEVTNVLLLATADENHEVQLDAITALEKREDKNKIPILLNRIKQPDKELSQAEKHHDDRIKKAAIRSIGIRNDNSILDKLYDIATNDLSCREDVAISLRRIGTSQVAEYLLDSAEPTRNEDSYKYMNLEFSIWSANVIAQVELTDALEERYRLFLYQLYREQVPLREIKLDSAIARFFNTEWSEIMLEILNNYSNRQDVIQRVLKHLIDAPLNSACPLWLQIFNHENRLIRSHRTRIFQESIADSIEEFAELLSRSIESNPDIAHKQDQLIEVVHAFANDHTKIFSDAIVPIIKDSEGEVCKVATRYMKVLWNRIKQESIPNLIENILTKGYLKRIDGRKTLGNIMVGYWNQTNDVFRRQIYQNILEYSHSLKPERKRKGIRELLKHIAIYSAAPAGLVELIVRDLAEMNEDDVMRIPLITALRSIPIKDDDLCTFCRQKLTIQPFEFPDGAESWFIDILGRFQHSQDIKLFSQFLSNTYSEATQISAIYALARQSDKQIGEMLCKSALTSRNKAVVIAAVDELGAKVNPTIEIVEKLQWHTDENNEDDADIRSKASLALDLITRKHLAVPISRETPKGQFEQWLKILQQIGICDCAPILETLLQEHSDSQFAGRRIEIVETIAKATRPEEGLEILIQAKKTERVDKVNDVIDNALNELERHPDRPIISLLEQITERPFNSTRFMGKWRFNDLFVETRTIAELPARMRRAINTKNDNDFFVTVLDSISDALLRDLFVADSNKLNPDGKIPENQHDAHIGKLKVEYPDIGSVADFIHQLRTNKALGVHPYTSTGGKRAGISDAEYQEAKSKFAKLFEEVIKVLRDIKDKSI